MSQGTVLGPLFYFILMHDIDIGMESDVVSFADDTRVYRGVSDTSYCDILRRDLDKVYK